MPTIAKLSDAAIAVKKALDMLGVEFGIFGGYAIAVLGGPRESKDIDCVVNCSKEWLVSKLDGFNGFQWTGNNRKDVACFIHSRHGILVEFFPTSMNVMKTYQIQVKGENGARETTVVLDPVLIFKGKLQVAAARSQHSDAADILFLEDRYNAILRARNSEYDTRLVGMALKQYPHLEYCFDRLGVDINASKAAEASMDGDALGIQVKPENVVQNGLLFNVKAPSWPRLDDDQRIPIVDIKPS